VVVKKVVTLPTKFQIPIFDMYVLCELVVDEQYCVGNRGE
jgi:hypothetical protein